MHFARYKCATQNCKKISCYFYYTIYFFESFWKRLFLYILNVYIWTLCVLLNLRLIKRRFLFYGFNAVPLCKDSVMQIILLSYCKLKSVVKVTLRVVILYMTGYTVQNLHFIKPELNKMQVLVLENWCGIIYLRKNDGIEHI